MSVVRLIVSYSIGVSFPSRFAVAGGGRSFRSRSSWPVGVPAEWSTADGPERSSVEARRRIPSRRCPLTRRPFPSIRSVRGAGAIQRTGGTGIGSRGPSAPRSLPGGVPARHSPARPPPVRISFASPSSSRRSCRERRPSLHRGRASPQLLGCSVMSVSQSSFGASAAKSRSTRSSWTGGPGFRFRPRFLENTDQMPWSPHKR